MYRFASGKNSGPVLVPKESLFGTLHFHDAAAKDLFHLIGSPARPTRSHGARERGISQQITYALIKEIECADFGCWRMRKSSHYVIRQVGESSPVWEGRGGSGGISLDFHFLFAHNGGKEFRWH
jgi:hypothetical protein